MSKFSRTQHLSVRIPESQYKELQHCVEVFKQDKTQLVIQALGLLFAHLRQEEKVLKESRATYDTHGMA